MLISLFIALFSALAEGVSSQLPIQWVGQFPVGYQMFPGDQVAIPLDPLTNAPGSVFSTVDPAYASYIQHPIVLMKVLALNEVKMIDCTLAF
jgi:hypothetical protein